jgi:hypothetical protein
MDRFQSDNCDAAQHEPRQPGEPTALRAQVGGEHRPVGGETRARGGGH